MLSAHRKPPATQPAATRIKSRKRCHRPEITSPLALAAAATVLAALPARGAAESQQRQSARPPFSATLAGFREVTEDLRGLFGLSEGDVARHIATKCWDPTPGSALTFAGCCLAESAGEKEIQQNI